MSLFGQYPSFKTCLGGGLQAKYHFEATFKLSPVNSENIRFKHNLLLPLWFIYTGSARERAGLVPGSRASLPNAGSAASSSAVVVKRSGLMMEQRAALHSDL